MRDHASDQFIITKNMVNISRKKNIKIRELLGSIVLQESIRKKRFILSLKAKIKVKRALHRRNFYEHICPILLHVIRFKLILQIKKTTEKKTVYIVI